MVESQTTLIYTGVGSRRTPSPMLASMTAIACELRERGYVCRSGHAHGADYAFESGAESRMELYLPWATYNDPPRYKPDRLYIGAMQTARSIAATLHPAWDRLTGGGQTLHARNVHQVLGWNCDKPSTFLICWTPNGQVTGGTATAIRLAGIKHIPIYNLWFAHDRARLEAEYDLPVAV